jgi:hypothetical protein
MANPKCFTQNEWNHLHDVVLDSTGKSKTREELLILFQSLPIDIKNDAYNYGMNDTVFRDEVFKYLEKINK